MMPGSPRIVGIGAVFIDDIVLPSGQTYMAQLGGGAVHAMMGAAVWGDHPGLVAPIGYDLPDAVRARLESAFDTRGLYPLNIPQIRAWQLFEEDGTRRELFRVRETEPFTRGAQPEYLPDCFQEAEGYYLLQGFKDVKRWRDSLPGFLLWEPLQQIMLPGNRDLLRDVLHTCRIDLISPNFVEAQAIYGELSADELVNALFEDGACRAALRMGEAGSLVADRETGERYRIPTVPVRQFVDQTGAGNTYCGGLLWGIIEGKTLREAGMCGAVSASFCLEQVGVLNPNQIETAERDQRWKNLQS